MRRLILGLVGVGVCLFVSACSGTTKDSGEDSGGTCGNTAGCGGNIVGIWKIKSSCVTVDPASMMNASCPGQTADTSDLKFAGTVTYAADMTYTTDFKISGTFSVNWPAACLMQKGITLTCAQLTQAIQSRPMMMGDTSGSCSSASDGGCTCKLSLTNEPSGESGTYTTTGSGLLTQTPTAGNADTEAYCVKGSTLTLSPNGDANGTGTLTLTKQ